LNRSLDKAQSILIYLNVIVRDNGRNDGKDEIRVIMTQILEPQETISSDAWEFIGSIGNVSQRNEPCNHEGNLIN